MVEMVATAQAARGHGFGAALTWAAGTVDPNSARRPDLQRSRAPRLRAVGLPGREPLDVLAPRSVKLRRGRLAPGGVPEGRRPSIGHHGPSPRRPRRLRHRASPLLPSPRVPKLRTSPLPDRTKPTVPNQRFDKVDGLVPMADRRWPRSGDGRFCRRAAGSWPAATCPRAAAVGARPTQTLRRRYGRRRSRRCSG